MRSATAASPPDTACEAPNPGNSGTMTRNARDKCGAIASKLARSDSSEWNRNSGGPLPETAAFTVPSAKSRSIAAPIQFQTFYSALIEQNRLDSSHSALDVIFHDCKKWPSRPKEIRCFCGIMSTKACALIFLHAA